MLLLFLGCSVLVIFGEAIFLVGIDNSILTIGELVGGNIYKLKKWYIISGFGFIFGFLATFAEPSVQILAQQVNSSYPEITPYFLIIFVSLGVGFFTAISFIKIIFKIKMKYLLLGSFLVLFTIMFFVNPDFIGIAFDGGGVTTGPITVPFILALGIGISSFTNNKNDNDSFGLVGLASIGPVISVLMLGFFYKESSIIPEVVEEASMSVLNLAGQTFLDVLLGLLPLLVVFIVFDIFFIKLPKKKLIKIFVGTLLTFVGLYLFLFAANLGFSTVAEYIGTTLVENGMLWVAIILAILFGFAVVFSEAAILILGNQVEKITNKSIKSITVLIIFALAVAIALVFAILKIYFDLNLMVMLLIMYVVVFVISFFNDELFIGMGFDSGGIATGPMTSTFIFPFILGIALGLGKGRVSAFGTISFVAFFPILAIELMGLYTKIKKKVASFVITEEQIQADYVLEYIE
jgi:hypothetical protein